jgi:hypothetical protein
MEVSMKGSRTRTRTARGFRVQPVLQPLEDRSVPTTFSNVVTVTDLINDINLANQAGGANTIVLQDNATFTLTTANNTTDGPTGLPVIAANDNLTIIGTNDIIQRSTAKGTPAFRLFDVAAGASLTLKATAGSSLTLQNGLSTGGAYNPTGLAATGGAINNLGTLSLTGVIVQNNTAQGAAGASGYDGDNAYGGGIYSFGSLTLNGCTIQNNKAIGGQGGKTRAFRSRLGKSFSGGYGGNALGGGLYLGNGTISLQGCTVTGNSAQGGPAGGIRGGDGVGEGGGIFTAPAASASIDTYTRNNVTGNTASTSDDEIDGSYTLVP